MVTGIQQAVSLSPGSSASEGEKEMGTKARQRGGWEQEQKFESVFALNIGKRTGYYLAPFCSSTQSTLCNMSRAPIHTRTFLCLSASS